ncbi:MAG: hypothetical protein HY508_12535 [Acidobacteria bacterium]|nr:hypothetical protein [Acidobacteriota bacterium]
MAFFQKRAAVGFLFAMVIIVPPCAAQKRATLNQLEDDRVREAHDPSERIVVYMDLMDIRLARFDEARHQPVDPKYDQASFLRDLLGEYIALNDELKSWIEDHYERTEDMRGGLRKLIERAPRQLVILRGIQQESGPHSESYRETLRDAIDQLRDAIDGATVALEQQTKKLGELKKQEKEEERLAKERAKEEARRTKQEKKERTRQDKKKTVPGDIPEE